jgi:hypothetical protein
MVVSFINDVWEPIHVDMGIFEVHNIVDANMVVHAEVLLYSFGLLDKVIAYVKYEKSN